MKAVFSLFALAAIIFMIFFSANLFLQGALIATYGLMIVWISSLILWVKHTAPLLSSFGLSAKTAKA